MDYRTKNRKKKIVFPVLSLAHTIKYVVLEAPKKFWPNFFLDHTLSKIYGLIPQKVKKIDISFSKPRLNSKISTFTPLIKHTPFIMSLCISHKNLCKKIVYVAYNPKFMNLIHEKVKN